MANALAPIVTEVKTLISVHLKIFIVSSFNARDLLNAFRINRLTERPSEDL